jgi:hypothetical protein
MLGPMLFGVSCLASGLAVRGLARILGAADAGHVSRALTLGRAKSFADAAPGDDVVASGAVGAGPEGPMCAPISGTQAAWVRVETTEERSTNPETSFESVSKISVGEMFEILLPDGARVPVRLGTRDVGGLLPTKTGPVVRPSATLAAYLEKHGVPAPSTDDFVRRREYVETALPIGGPLSVMGLKRTGRGATGSTYRDGGEDAWVEPTIADAQLDARRIRLLAEPEGPGIGVVLGWIVAVGGPVAAVVLGVEGTEPELAAAVLGPPACTLGLWLGLGILRVWFFE